jgi:hypothetical protein
VIWGRQTSNFEALGGLYERGQLGLRHRGLTLVHEVDDALDLPAADVLQHNDWVLAWIVCEDLLEVWTGKKIEKNVEKKFKKV